MFRKSIFSFQAVALLVLLAFNSTAQVIYSEDFENGMPSGFTLIDGDGLTPNSQVDYVTDAWVAYPDFADANNTVAISTSYYEPVGMANDWMITSLIHVDSVSVLQWKAEAFTASYPDGYEVRISTVSIDTSDFLANAPLFSIANELTTRTSRRVDLAALGYANQNVYIAFRNNSNDQWTLVIDDIEIINRPSLEAALVSIEIPNSVCQLTNAEDISVDIENFGTGTLSNFDVSYVVSDGITTDTTSETILSVIQPGDTLTYTFTQKADFSLPGTQYTVSAFITVAGDNFSDNNTVDDEVVINVLPHDAATPYISSFEFVDELLGWVVDDNNIDGLSWYLSASVPNTGDLHFRYNFNPDLPADDWLYSTCLDLVAGTIYKLSFFHRVGNSQGTVFPEKLEVKLGMSQDTSGMDLLLKDLDSLYNDYYQEETIIFTAPATGTHFIGFHVYSDKDQFFLALDDIAVYELLPPVASFVSGKNELEVSFASTSEEADSLYWDFGDGNTSTDNPSAIHTYATAGTYYVCLTAFNQAGSDTFCDSVSVDTLISGVGILDDAQIKIYPNPTKGFVIIETSSVIPGASVSINDMAGKELLPGEFTSAKMIFDLKDLPGGFYFVEVKTGSSSIREKILLSR